MLLFAHRVVYVFWGGMLRHRPRSAGLGRADRGRTEGVPLRALPRSSCQGANAAPCKITIFFANIPRCSAESLQIVPRLRALTGCRMHGRRAPVGLEMHGNTATVGLEMHGKTGKVGLEMLGKTGKVGLEMLGKTGMVGLEMHEKTANQWAAWAPSSVYYAPSTAHGS